MRKMVFTVTLAALAALSLLAPTAGMAGYLIEDAEEVYDYEWCTAGVYASYTETANPDNPDLGPANLTQDATPYFFTLYLVVSYINADNGGNPDQEFIQSIGGFSAKLTWDSPFVSMNGTPRMPEGVNVDPPDSDPTTWEYGFNDAQPYDDPYGGDEDHSFLLVEIDFIMLGTPDTRVPFYLVPNPYAGQYHERMLIVDGDDVAKYLWMRPASAPAVPLNEIDPDEYDEPVFVLNPYGPEDPANIAPSTWSNVKATFR